MKRLLIAAAALAATTSVHAANLITNGSFETGDFTGWTQGGNTGFTGVTNGAFAGNNGAEDGVYWAYLGPVGSDGTLSQTFSDTAGQLYSISFYYSSDGGTPNDLSATVDGLAGSVTDDPAHDWIQAYGTFIGNGTDTLTFSFRNDPGYLGLDNVVIEAVGVPEPAVWASMLLGLGLAGATLRRRRAIAA